MTGIKALQENLARDLVKLEESDIDEVTLAQIEDVYKEIYNTLCTIDRKKD
jgi:hypothetical protein